MASCWFSSVLTFAVASFSGWDWPIASTTGETRRHGPHQGAQKSTKTGFSAFSTSDSKVDSSTVIGAVMFVSFASKRALIPRAATGMLALDPDDGPMAVHRRDAYGGVGAGSVGVGVGTGVGVGVGNGVGAGVGVGCGPLDSTMSTWSPFGHCTPSAGLELMTVPESASENFVPTAPRVSPAWLRVFATSSRD